MLSNEIEMVSYKITILVSIKWFLSLKSADHFGTHILFHMLDSNFKYQRFQECCLTAGFSSFLRLIIQDCCKKW